jgi:hypothetical protein
MLVLKHLCFFVYKIFCGLDYHSTYLPPHKFLLTFLIQLCLCKSVILTSKHHSLRVKKYHIHFFRLSPEKHTIISYTPYFTWQLVSWSLEYHVPS